MADPERGQDDVKQEAYGRRSGGFYVFGRSQNRIPTLILIEVKTLEDNQIILFTFMCQEEIQTQMSMKSL